MYCVLDSLFSVGENNIGLYSKMKYNVYNWKEVLKNSYINTNITNNMSSLYERFRLAKSR